MTITPSISSGGVSFRKGLGLTLKFWMLTKFFVITLSIVNCEKKDFTCSFWAFYKKLLQSIVRGESFANFKIIITKRKKIAKKCIAIIIKRDVATFTQTI